VSPGGGAAGVPPGSGITAAGARWPDADVSVRYGWLVPRWIATSQHPRVGAVRGWGFSRAGALRSLARRTRRP
jgi:hypothetical protein